MSENERVHFKIALPIELKKRLEHIAVENRRSLSAEIINRLEATLDDAEPESAATYWDMPEGISDEIMARAFEKANRIAVAMALRELGIVQRPLSVGGKDDENRFSPKSAKTQDDEK